MAIFFTNPYIYRIQGPSFSMTGGTVTVDGNYTYRTFTASETLYVEGSVELDYLVVAGGAGGGGGRTLLGTVRGSGGAGGGR